MTIRASSSKQIDTLIADLTGTDPVKRDAAVARLTVIGARAVDRLAGVARSGAPGVARAAALRALEGIGDEHARRTALATIEDGDAVVARSAIAVARSFLRGARGAEVVDALTRVVLDRGRDDTVRAAAVRALRDLEPKTIAPLMKSLAEDPSAEVRAAAGERSSQGSRGSPGSQGSRGSRGSPGSQGSQGSREALDGVREWLAREGGKAPLASILELIERIREREGHEREAFRAEWATARMAAHLVLARRGSRVALYDLKESLEKAAAPMPVDALAALSRIGDASCLEPIASAFAKANDKWWRDHLLETFHVIVKREKLTKRHAVMKRIEKKFALSTP